MMSSLFFFLDINTGDNLFLSCVFISKYTHIWWLIVSFFLFVSVYFFFLEMCDKNNELLLSVFKSKIPEKIDF
jgi:hypothetical protein